MLNTCFDELKKTNYKNVAFELSSAMLAAGKSYESHVESIALALALLDLQNKNESNCKTFSIEDLSYDGELKDIIHKYVNGLWDIVLKKLYRFTNNELKAFILFDNSFEMTKSGMFSTPNSINELACKILDIEDNETVLELCSGKGSFAVQSFIVNQSFNYKGIELNYVARDIAIMRFSLLSKDFSFILSDAFDYSDTEKADKVFSNYPFKLHMPSLAFHKNKLANIFGMPGEIIQKSSSDWLFNLKMINQMKDSGKALAIMTNGSTWNAPDKGMRRFFIENGWIEAIISLPSKLFLETPIPTTMIIMSKGNQKVRLVDATHLCIQNKRNAEFSTEHIRQILTALKEDNDYSITVSKEELAKNEYTLYATRYLSKGKELENGVTFESIIKNITRGSQLKAEELDALKSKTVTPYQYIMLSNIDSGIASIGDDQYLSEMPKKLEKYCIRNNSIVLSKIGGPTFKSAVISIAPDKKLLANGNLFVIEIDETKADPYYIQAYFSSDAGIAAFKNIYSGAYIATISLENLKKMIIPLPELETQKEIGYKYAACIDELMVLNRKIRKVTDKMHHLFDEEG